MRQEIKIKIITIKKICEKLHRPLKYFSAYAPGLALVSYMASCAQRVSLLLYFREFSFTLCMGITPKYICWHTFLVYI